MAFIISKVSHSLIIALNVTVKAAKTSSSPINWALNIVQKITKVSTTAINLLRDGNASNKILELDSRVALVYHTATKVNQLCGVIELPIRLISLIGAIVDEVVMHHKDGIEDVSMHYDSKQWEAIKISRIKYRSVSALYQYSVLNSSLYILVRIIECIRPINNAIAFCKGKVHIPDKLESLSNKLMGPSLIFTSIYLSARIVDNEISPDWDTGKSPAHWRQFTIEFFSSISRIVIGIFLTINSFSKNKRDNPLNMTIMTYFGLEAICFIHLICVHGIYTRHRTKRDSAELLSNPF